MSDFLISLSKIVESCEKERRKRRKAESISDFFYSASFLHIVAGALFGFLISSTFYFLTLIF
jgi:hypothetical protein